MNRRNCLLMGLALVVAFTLTMGLPGGAQAQQKAPTVSSGPAAQDYASGSYGYDGTGYAYCPMGPGYGYSAPDHRDYRNTVTRTRGRGYQGAGCPWNSGYARSYRGGWGCW